MKTARIDIRVDPGLLARVDAQRKILGQSRTVFIERALEAALGSTSVSSDRGSDGASEGEGAGSEPPRSAASASPRTPEPEETPLPKIAARRWP